MMKKRTILAAAILCGTPLAMAARPAPPPAGVGVAAAFDDFEELEAEFTEAVAVYEKKLADADRQERRELRRNAPATRYWSRFEALAEAGEGRAALWLVEHVTDNREIRSSDRGAVLNPLYRSLVADHASEEWFPRAVESLGANAKYLADGAALEILGDVLATEAGADAKAAALFYSAEVVEDDAKKKAFVARIVEEYPNTVYGTAARALTAKAEDSEVGKVAPTFVGRTIDGFQFSLEDYRGKVVLLDFYGFW